jgi:transcriptional regulator with XRE-family HTH domain
MKVPSESDAGVRFDTGALLRKVRGKMTREAFSELLGVSSSTVVRYESNERAPDAEFLLRLNVLYGLDPLYVLTGKTANLGGLVDAEVELVNAYRAADAAGQALIAATAAMAAKARAVSPPAAIVQTSQGDNAIQIAKTAGKVSIKRR